MLLWGKKDSHNSSSEHDRVKTLSSVESFFNHSVKHKNKYYDTEKIICEQAKTVTQKVHYI